MTYNIYSHFFAFDIDEISQYRFFLSAYFHFWRHSPSFLRSSTIVSGDSMYVHNNQSFSTLDKDHDALVSTNCAAKNKGGWWYHKCYLANLNGPYHNGEMSNTEGYDDNDWFTWDFTSSHNLKKTEMKMRSSVISHQ